jgi:hypothetical protein
MRLLTKLVTLLRNACTNSYWIWQTSTPEPPEDHAPLWYIQTAYANDDGTFRKDPDRGPLWSDRAAMLEEMARHTGPGGVINQWSPTSTLGYGKPDEELHQWRDAEGTMRYFYVMRYRDMV